MTAHPPAAQTIYQASDAFQGLQSSGADRLRKRLVVAFVLVGVAFGEVEDRPVELVVSPRYSAMATGSPERAWARARVQPQMPA
jgi:hypothetical protein